MVADFPFTGAGMGTFNDVGALLYPFYEVNNPGTHNWYLQVGVDLGIPGLITLLVALYQWSRNIGEGGSGCGSNSTRGTTEDCHSPLI